MWNKRRRLREGSRHYIEICEEMGKIAGNLERVGDGRYEDTIKWSRKLERRTKRRKELSMSKFIDRKRQEIVSLAISIIIFNT